MENLLNLITIDNTLYRDKKLFKKEVPNLTDWEE